MFDTLLIYSTELISFFQLLVSWLFLFLCAWRYGKSGVYIYMVVAVILSNLQVLKFGQFVYSNEPVAMGTVVFASTFLATDILTEFYSAEAARRSVTLGFIGFAFFSVLMLMHVQIPPISPGLLHQHGLTDAHDAMHQLFTPMPVLYVASIISYFISERLDIAVYATLKTKMNSNGMWFRSIIAATLSAFMDTAVFSVLAWKVFALQPVSWATLMYTYILGSFWPRVIISMTGVPLLYLLKRHHRQNLVTSGGSDQAP